MIVNLEDFSFSTTFTINNLPLIFLDSLCGQLGPPPSLRHRCLEILGHKSFTSVVPKSTGNRRQKWHSQPLQQDASHVPSNQSLVFNLNCGTILFLFSQLILLLTSLNQSCRFLLIRLNDFSFHHPFFFLSPRSCPSIMTDTKESFISQPMANCQSRKAPPNSRTQQ